jgi:precorrin-2 dehydrogenase / sirohydrochlorin ferrochelatase
VSPTEPVFPVGLVVAGRKCLVVGGGHVAGRKTRSLLACRASVTMVATEAHEALGMLASDGTIGSIDADPLDVQLRPYVRGEAAGYMLVVTATGIPEVDRAVAEDATRAGVWVNSADDPENCTFLMPAVHRRGPVTIAVSTSGSSPSLATWLRDRVGETLGPSIEELATLLEETREMVHQMGASTEGLDWAGLLDGPLPGLVAEGRMEEARLLIQSALLNHNGNTSHGPRE